MSANGTVEKKAMTDAERAKYIKAVILSAVGAAGIGSIIRSREANKKRKKEGNPESSHNTIIVPISKSKFMDELPTPKELAESRGEQIGHPDGATVTSGNAYASPSDASAMADAELNQEQIAAKKKEILGNGRKFNFFGKKASVKKVERYDEDKKNGAPNVEKREEYEGRTLLRDQEGKFASLTDSVAVAQAEKDAFDLFGIGEFAKNNIDAALDKPVLLTAGAMGSLYIAAKISDAINERRKTRAKERLENAREEYVGLLNGSEKKAEDGWDTFLGRTLGTTFFVPAALTALVTTKIIENRKAEKKKQKETSDSYPDDPIILYKTSEAKEIPIDPETALALFLVKRAMIENIERESLSKYAQQGLPAQASGYGQLGVAIKDSWEKDSWDSFNSANQDTAMDDAFDFLKDDKNADLVLDLVKSYGPGGTSRQKNEARNAIGSRMGTFGNWWKGNGKFWKDKAFQAKLVSDPRMIDLLATRFNNNDKYVAYRNQLIDNELGKTFTQGGILHSIVSWIMKNTGIGAYMFNSRLKDRLASFGSSNSVQMTTPDAKPTEGQPVATAPVQKLNVPNVSDKKYLKTDGAIDTELWNKDFTAWKNQR